MDALAAERQQQRRRRRDTLSYVDRWRRFLARDVYRAVSLCVEEVLWALLDIVLKVLLLVNSGRFFRFDVIYASLLCKEN